jgi:hypothetical protein
MGTNKAITKVSDELNRAFERTRAELERVEILAAGLAAFHKPVPNYEPTFRHLRQLNLAAHELPSD